ncbi:hypothetical protein BGW38_001040, partial [Lunasporangiospora selenospora]
MAELEPTQVVCLVDRILDKRIGNDTGLVHYLIRWQGCDAQGNAFEDTWEPEQNVLGEELIEEFERSQQAQQQRAPRDRKRTTTSSSRASGPDQREPLDDRHIKEKDMHRPPSQKDPNDNLKYQGYPPHHQSPYMYHPLMRPPPGYYPFHPTYQQPPAFPPPYPTTMRHPLHHSMTHPDPMGIPGRAPGAQSSPSSANHSASTSDQSTLKRKASLTNGNAAAEQITHMTPNASSADPTQEQSKGVSGLNGGSPITNGRLEGPKRIKDGQSPTMTRNGASSGLFIKALKLDLESEKAFFRTVIERSTIVKDLSLRREMISFLRDPKNPGLVNGASLLGSDTWLIELKKHRGGSGSLFLALDLPSGIVKAMSIPEQLLENSRKGQVGEGIVITDHSIVSSIMAGNTGASGMLQSLGSSGASEKSLSITTNSAEKVSEPTHQSPSNGILETSMDMSEPSGPTTSFKCEWMQCGQLLGSLKELSDHVQKQHLQSFSIAKDPESLPEVAMSSPIMTPTAVSKSAAENDTLLRKQYHQLAETVRALRSEIVNTREMVSNASQQFQESTTLYTSSVDTSEENIKRMEAHLEWEKEKWSQYQSNKQRMSTNKVNKGQEESAVQTINRTDQQGSDPVDNDAMDITPEHIRKDSGPSSSTLVPMTSGDVLDKPFEAQSMNSIQEIQRLLMVARQSQARLARDNAALSAKKRELDEQDKRLAQHFQESVAQLASLEAQDQESSEELQKRSETVKANQTAMEQEKAQAELVVGQLQSMIGALLDQTQSAAIPSSSSLPVQNQPTATEFASLSSTTAATADTATVHPLTSLLPVTPNHVTQPIGQEEHQAQHLSIAVSVPNASVDTSSQYPIAPPVSTENLVRGSLPSEPVLLRPHSLIQPPVTTQPAPATSDDFYTFETTLAVEDAPLAAIPMSTGLEAGPEPMETSPSPLESGPGAVSINTPVASSEPEAVATTAATSTSAAPSLASTAVIVGDLIPAQTMAMTTAMNAMEEDAEPLLTATAGVTTEATTTEAMA